MTSLIGGARVTRCPALCGKVTHYHFFVHIPQIKTLSRIVIDSQTRLFIYFWNATFIIWHLSNSCVRRQQWGLSSGGGARCLIMSIKLGRIRRWRARPPTRNSANQVRTACSTRRRKARLVRLRRGNAATIKNGNSSWQRPVQGESGNVWCEVCLSHFSISQVNTTWNDTNNAGLIKNVTILFSAYYLIVYTVVSLVVIVQ